ncbi:lysosomal aspartic protease isoform X2 [Halyomorpha halys]|uniref:lysosomal aspartic protease isoform X2 n=1 Tax=Halyomorpha halys TaxID=286706 RepID=UPI0006D51B89|nr:aspartic proteinase-like isoform X2 [Halyomorpha halys]
MLLSAIVFATCYGIASGIHTILLKKHIELEKISFSTFQSNVDYYKDSLESYLRGLSEAKFDKNVEYSGFIGLGDPQQIFMMYFDTSFSGLWVISNDCNWSYYVCYKKKHKYEKERSFSYQPDNYTGYGNYGQIKGQSLSIEGFFVLDTLWLDNSNDASDQQFLAATTFCTDSFLCMLDASLIPDGLFGLGFPSSDVMMGPPFLTVLDRGLISSPSFSLYINRVTLDESELCHHKCTVIIDTGTSIIAVPLDVLKTIYKILKIDTPNPERLVPIPCDNITILPTLTFHIEDTAYNISGKDYVIQLSDICVIGFMENRNSNQWVLGYLFLKNFYTIFNYGTRQIGLANTK